MVTSRKHQLAKVFFLTSAIGGAELVLDGGFAEADIVSGNFGVINQTSNTRLTITNIPGGGTADAGLNINGNTRFSWSYGSASLRVGQTATSSSNDWQLLGAGDVVGAALVGDDFGYVTGGFDGFIGFSFVNGADTHYGYARAVANADGTEVSLTEYFYEDTPNTAITVQAAANVPEPSSLAVLALGAAGLASFRRRREER